MTEELLTDIFSLAVLVILLISNKLNRIGEDRQSRRFSNVVITTLAYLLANSTSIILEEHPGNPFIAYAVNLLAFIFVDCVIVTFCFYLSGMLKSTESRNLKAVRVPLYTCAASVAINLGLSISGNLFYIDAQGIYQESSLCFISYCVSGLEMLELVWIVIRNHKCFTVRQFVVILLYLCLPLIPVFLEVRLNLYSLTSVTMTLSLLLMYLLVQNTVIEQSKVRESILEEISSTDLLTGLNNRRSYYMRLTELKPDQPAGVVYCDINNLKYTNDHFGHTAGDELIKKFAGILSSCFRTGEVYRISGDEFVVILADIPEEAFKNRIEKLRKLIDDEGVIAAMGHSYGIGSCIDRLISESEQLMYEDKRKYHGMNKDGRG